MIKVHSTQHRGLCVRCQEAVVKTFENDHVEIWCQATHMNPQQITRPVIRCSYFRDTNSTSRRDYEQIAWVLRTDKKGGVIGFQPPKPKKDDD